MSLSRIAFLGAPVLAAFALVACGGDDSPSSASASAGGSPSASPSASASPGGAAASPSAAPGSASPSAPGSSATGTAASGGGSGSSEGTVTPSVAANTVPAGVTPRGPLPTPDGRYCDTITRNSPPNSLLGILKLKGKDAPAGTPVQVMFDGVAGPAEYTRADGGYRVDFGTASGDCPNKNGAKLTLVIDGKTYDTGATVGSLPAIRFDIND